VSWCWQKAADGDVSAQTFIRDTMDGKPLQRSDDIVPAAVGSASSSVSAKRCAARMCVSFHCRHLYGRGRTMGAG
jgi:hypothetical protein